MAEPSRFAWKGEGPPSAHRPPRARIVCGDAIDVLRRQAAGTVQTCITSPPYWGLRDYNVRPRRWGGERACRHAWAGSDGAGRGDFCHRCRGWRGCLGLEPDPDLYVEHLVAVLREARRVLREDGTLWLNLGDCYAGTPHWARHSGFGRPISDKAFAGQPGASQTLKGAGLKAKDLVGVPWRVALALQADGWWLRSDIVWSKPNPMPESVRDRPTRSHEYVFLLAKSSRYFYDSFAVRESDKGGSTGNGFERPERLSYGGPTAPRGQEERWVGGGGRNRRSVWTIATRCFKGAHFATFPEGLVAPCVLAGTSPVACRVCEAPWRRLVSSRRLLDGRHELAGSWADEAVLTRSSRAPRATGYGHWRVQVRRETVGWEPTCEHDSPGARCLVLDPFAGAGTTGIVAEREGRDFLGIELSSTYARMARKRLHEGRPSPKRGARR